MHHQFLNNVQKKQLFEPKQKVLLAVSGGIDSMVLLHLFEKSNHNYGLIHCNFQLRKKESDGDEQFVREQAMKQGVPAFFQHFDTEEYAKIKGISIEMAARELRYNYFEKIRSEKNYDFIATAHHQDDLIETFFLNLSRKTGIKGLTGIKEKSGKLIRPLLFANREEIECFATENNIEFREDSSNREIVFKRNFLRHKILPLFTELNPSFNKNLLASIQNLKEAEQVYLSSLDEEKTEIANWQADRLVVDIDRLKKSKFPKVVLLELLAPYKFNSVVVKEILNGLDKGSGNQYYSNTHRVLKDRNQLFVLPLEEPNDKSYYIEESDLELSEPFRLAISKLSAADFTISKEKMVACIDLDKIEFPLLMRKWRQGDYFQPLGMTGLKKVSDFFIDQKIPICEKENTWLLCSGKKIVWIMGHRIDDRFKIDEATKNILKIQCFLESE